VRVCETRRFSATLSAIAAAGVLSLVALDAADVATGGTATHTVTIRVAVVYSAVGVWRGTFVSVLPTGRVVDRGRVVERPRQKLGADWAISRTLSSTSGTLRFFLRGPYTRPLARLTWTILSGTGAYSGLKGTGGDVEHVSDSSATARMNGVPAQ
jgi:hypothetical protein